MNIRWLFNTRAEASTILIRLSIGLVVFVPEGVQKLIFPGILGAGRFARIGIPFPHVMGPFVGTVEIVCGVLIMVGLCTRLATVPLIIVMIVAIIRRRFRSSSVTISDPPPRRGHEAGWVLERPA